MSMRVAFSGASGTGKSTLAEYVAKKYSLPINPVGSRSVALAMGFDNPYDVDKAGKRGEFQRRLVAAKVEWEATHEDFVTDRTTLDNIAYTALHDVAAIDSDLLLQAVRGVHRYSHVIMCPMDLFIDTANDPARIPDMTYHALFEIMTFGLVDRNAGWFRRHKLDCRALVARQEEVDGILEATTECEVGGG